MKKIVLFLSFLALSGGVFAQRKITTSATVAFDASTSLDNLPKAENKTAIAAIDTKTGAVQFEAAVKNFAFANPMMQDHFNGTNWMNSEAFPKFSFKGAIVDMNKANFEKNGTYTISVTGDLTVKNITKQITAPATLVVKDGILNALAGFSIRLSDYEISGVPIDAGKVAKEPRITVSAELK
jgi:polyisoprenoid-binding protein YceI